MNGFAPGLLDRLMGDYSQPNAGGTVSRLTMEQLKESVARDLEALLNTRIGIPPQVFADYPEARRSIVNYGLLDFAGLCLSSSEDRSVICNRLTSAIETHEPRLKNVSAALELEKGSVNRLTFVINATLHMHSAAEAVNFNAVLQPSSLNYAITKAARPHKDGTRWTSTSKP